MSRFRTVHRGRPASTGAAVIYDNRFGTDTTTAASTGWFTFGLNASSKRIWCDASKADDSGNGLTAATAKKTYEAAFRLWQSGFTPGDQLMFAGTGGRTYTDPGASGGSPTIGNATYLHGISLAYPAAVLCYDPANPADTTKYGKLYGADQPVIQLSGASSSLNKSSDGSDAGTPDPSPGIDHYFAIQGITFDGLNAEGNSLTYIGRHDGFCVQNCRFPTAELSFDNASSTYGRSQTLNVSKCSFYGQWASSGNAAGGFAHGLDGLWRQDNVFVHCGWKLGASRTRNLTTYPNTTAGNDAWAAAGGANVFGHGWYYAANNINGRSDREVYANSAADGLNCRGGVTVTQAVSLREPIACNIGGFSNNVHEAPSGVLVTIDDYVVMEGTDIDDTVNPRGYGITNTNTISGSYVKNSVFADNSQYGDTNNHVIEGYNGNDRTIVSITHSGTTATLTTDSAHGLNTGDQIYLAGASPSAYNVSAASITVTSTTTFTYTMLSTPATDATVVGAYTPQVPSQLLIDGMSSYNYSPIFNVAMSGAVPGIVTQTYANVVADALAPGTGNSVATSGTFPSRKTLAQLITAMGFASENAMYNAMVCYPHLPWAQAIHGIILPAYNRTPQFATASVPDISGLTAPPTISW